MISNNKANKQTPLVSVVIATKNEEKNIANCLKSILWQSYPKKCIEAIIVDNYSTDKTVAIAKKYTPHVFLKGPERSVQKNFGMITKAHGDYVMFLDADMIMSPDLIESAVTFLKSNKYVAIYIPEIILGNTFWSRVRRFERSFYNGTVIDGLRIFDRQVFREVGGFDEKMWACEDWDLDKRIKVIGKTVLLGNYNYHTIDSLLNNVDYHNNNITLELKNITTNTVIFHNESNFNVVKYLSKKRYYINNFNQYLNKWGGTDPDIRKQFGFKYRYFEVFFENGKWKQFVTYPLMMMSVYLLKILVGVEYIRNKSIWKKRN